MSAQETLLHPWESPQEFHESNYNSHNSGPEASFPPQNALKEANNIGGTVIRFIFWKHTPENYQSIVPLIEGCDIIAREGVLEGDYETLQQQQQAAKQIRLDNEFISATISGKYTPKAGKYLKKNGFPIDEIVMRSAEERAQILANVMGEASVIFIPYIDRLSRVIKIDTEPQHASEAKRLHDEHLDTLKESLDAISLGGAGWEEIKQNGYNSLVTNEAALIYRDSIAAKQIEDLARENPGKTIGILYGKAHQLLTRHIEAPIPGVSMQRVFAEDSSEHKSTRSFIQTYTSLINGLRGGYLEEKLFDEYLCLCIALTTVNQEVVERINNMDGERFEQVLHLIKMLWQEPIDKNSDDFDKKVIERRATTENIILNRKQQKAPRSIASRIRTRFRN